MKKTFAVTAAIVLLSMGLAAQAVVIETVPVGDPGNVGQLSGAGAGGFGPDRICGSVGYNYRIGKYEVTASQYTEFLNAKAATDTYGLYNPSMSETTGASGITRSGDSGSYTYSVASDFVNRPVNCVSYWDACRFANWLSNGQGAGSTERGAYTLDGYNGDDGRTIQRNPGARWALTSEDEWYKAAYCKGGSTSAGYWLYPTQHDAPPGRDMDDASGNNANYRDSYTVSPIDSGKWTTVVGEFQNSDSPYGTFDQAGNVWEWNEALTVGANRGVRGGSYASFGLRGSDRGYTNAYPTLDSPGFRVVALGPVPEPSSFIALAGGLISLLGMRRRRA